MRSVHPRAVENIIIRKIKAAKHGAYLETSFQHCLYHLYKSFRPVVAITHPHGVDAQPKRLCGQPYIHS